MIANLIKRSVGVLCVCAFFILGQELAWAKKAIPKAPDPGKEMFEAQKMVTEEQKALYEQLPVEETSLDGYWWNKQDKNEKINLVKQLIKGFELEDKKLSAKKIVSQLDLVYNPKDNPLDIKMDKSVERMFDFIIKGMILK